MSSLFLNPALLLGGAAFALIAVPIAIHLINLLRHRRVQWAAMEFLLQSQKKNSTWIRLKQLLLLLARMGAVAAVIVLLAQPYLRNNVAGLLGAAATHHVVLLDDSFSQSDRWADASAFDAAKQVVERLVEQAAGEPTPQTFSLLRFSRVGPRAAAPQPDVFQRTIDEAFAVELALFLSPLTPSQQDVGPAQALEAAARLLEEPVDEQRLVYLVSDFRARDWRDPKDLTRLISSLDEAGAEVQLVNCVDAARGNLAVAALRPQPGVRAAGVPLLFDVAVTNFSAEPVRQVPILLEEDGVQRASLVIDEIGPRQTEARQFSVFFSTAGQHVVTARLEDDPVEADNVRHEVVDFSNGAPVLLVDGAAAAADARFLEAALAPGGQVRTGLVPRIEPPSFLNSAQLDEFQSIYVMNTAHLDGPAIDALEEYARRGGGAAFFLGPESSGSFITERLYRDGAGMFPLPVRREQELPVNRLEKTADVEVADHPIFRIFAGERNSFLAAVNIDRYFTTDDDWAPPADSTTRVIARLRGGGAPLVVEHSFGAGRVVAVLTTAAPTWNNWGRNPSFVVAMLELQSHLATSAAQATDRLVGQPIELTLDAARYAGPIRFAPPGESAAAAVVVDPTRQVDHLTAMLSSTDVRGVYQADLPTTDGNVEVRRYAVNVSPQEGDLAVVDGQQLARRLAGAPFQYHTSGEFFLPGRGLAGFHLGEAILYALLGLLIVEQLLAYSASYHPVRRPGGG